MTSVVMRMLGRSAPRSENDYRPNAALVDAHLPPPIGGRRAPVMAAVQHPGETPLVKTAEPAHEDAAAAPAQAGVSIEVAAAPASDSPTLDILMARGWQRRSTR